jgi:hypothetical protein
VAPRVGWHDTDLPGNLAVIGLGNGTSLGQVALGHPKGWGIRCWIRCARRLSVGAIEMVGPVWWESRRDSHTHRLNSPSTSRSGSRYGWTTTFMLASKANYRSISIWRESVGGSHRGALNVDRGGTDNCVVPEVAVKLASGHIMQCILSSIGVRGAFRSGVLAAVRMGDLVHKAQREIRILLE